MNDLIPVEHQGQRILTTEQLAEVYETDVNNIQANFKRNESRFIEGIHFFKLEGEVLKAFKNQPTISQLVSKHTSQLYLWPERGANRHCKILDTDKAWEQFDRLEKTYFNVKELDKQLKTTIPAQNEAQRLRAEAMHLNAKTNQAKLLKEIALEFKDKLSEESVQLLVGGVAEILIGKPLFPLQTVERTYTATEIGEELGVSANKIGKIANANNLKNEEYGITVLDKSPHSSKQVSAFRYNERGREKLRELITGGVGQHE